MDARRTATFGVLVALAFAPRGACAATLLEQTAAGGLTAAVVAAIAVGIGIGRWRSLRTERRALEARIGERDQEIGRLKALLDLVPQGVFWQRDDGTIALANRQYDAMVDDHRMVADGAVALLGRDLARRARATTTEQTESIHVAASGEPRLLALTARALPGGGVGLCVADHTVIEQLHADLSRHVAANGEVLENLRTAIAIYGADRRLSFANAAFATLGRLDRGWLESEPALPEVLEALRERRRLPEYVDFPAFKRSQTELFRSLTGTREDLMHLPDDTTIRVLVTPHPFGGLMFTYEDVTDNLALERSFNTLIAVQRETLDNLHEGVALFGLDGRLKLFNPALASIWQLPAGILDQEPTLSRFLDLIEDFFGHLPNWDVEKNEILSEVASREPRHGVHVRSDGAIIEYTSSPLSDGATLLTYLDVTARERVERALRDRTSALEAADRLKTEFIANVSYELRTPLNTIIGFAEILANQYFGVLTPRQIEYSEGILESSQRLLSLINDILDLATIEAGYMSLELEEVDLHTLLANAIGLMRERARSQQVGLVLDCSPGIGIIVADGRRIKQAVFNLLSNAFNFTPPNGQVTLSARRGGGEVQIAVADTGIGIPQPDQGRVFERFERAHSSVRFRGAGLGLSLVKSFFELHGGRVELVSAPNSGTTVIGYMPDRASVEVEQPSAPTLRVIGK
jgi:signal transduction histidine kinase